jgi:hypothetical protein
MIAHIGMFGLMKTIRTDGGSQFTAKVCEDLSAVLKYEHLVIVPHHPEANGLVERRNAEVMKHLRALVMAKKVHDTWFMYLPLVQRILNYTVDGSLHTMPSKIIFGDMLADISFDHLVSYDNAPVSEYLANLKHVQLALIAETQKHLADEAQKRDNRVVTVDPDQALSFDVGEYILLAYPNRPPNKLSSLYRGPMVIEAKIRDDLYQVLDLVTNKVYDVHIDRLRKLRIPNGISRQELLQLSAADVNEFEVEAILDHRGNPRRKSSMEFLVRWKGYDSADDTWEPWTNVKDLAAMDIYSRQHPTLGLG